jgi:hypothetical protein
MSASPPHFVHGSLTHSLDRLRPHPVGVRVDDTTADVRGVCNWGAFWQVTQGQVQTGQGCGVKTISNTPTGTTSEPALARQYCYLFMKSEALQSARQIDQAEPARGRQATSVVLEEPHI